MRTSTVTSAFEVKRKYVGEEGGGAEAARSDLARQTDRVGGNLLDQGDPIGGPGDHEGRRVDQVTVENVTRRDFAHELRRDFDELFAAVLESEAQLRGRRFHEFDAAREVQRRGIDIDGALAGAIHFVAAH
ncbi:MAG: hypothetical protein R2748_16240 [Bryobacterales bacterium]